MRIIWPRVLKERHDDRAVTIFAMPYLKATTSISNFHGNQVSFYLPILLIRLLMTKLTAPQEMLSGQQTGISLDIHSHYNYAKTKLR